MLFGAVRLLFDMKHQTENAGEQLWTSDNNDFHADPSCVMILHHMQKGDFGYK